MKRSYVLLAIALAAGVFAVEAAATPAVNGALLKTRIFNDCPISTLATVNTYPAEISFREAELICFGFANLHNWSFSADGGMTEAVFNNGDSFVFGATVVVSGANVNGGEGGLRLSPWWGQDTEGRFNVRIPDGEVACFGGVLPFYSFTGSHGIHYVAGQPIRLEVYYNPYHNSAAFPGQVKYRCYWMGVWYDSGWLPFGNCTPGEEIHGCYGIMDNARAGGYAQHRLTNGQFPAENLTNFFDVVFAEQPVATLPTTWGKVKGLYR